jgi:hypothetical protein
MRLSNRIIPRDEKGVSENEAHRKAEGSGARSEGQSESRRTSRSGGGDSGKRGCSQARRSVRRASGVRPPPVHGINVSRVSGQIAFVPASEDSENDSDES